MDNKQLEILNGSMLGDGSIWINKNKPHINCKLQIKQSQLDKKSIDKKEYLNWFFAQFKQYSNSVVSGVLKKKFPFYCFTTYCYEIFTKLEQKWYLRDENGKYILNELNRRIKIVPKDLKLTPLTICVWYMDDGYAYPENANSLFCTHGFTFDECEFLSKRLLEDVGIKSKVRERPQLWKGKKSIKPIIYIGRSSYFDLINLIKPFVEWKCFQYKIDDTTYNKKTQIGVDHSQAKLTEEQVVEIFKLEATGWKHKDIGKKMNVSQASVTNIINGKTWNHLSLSTKTSKKPRVTQEQKQKVLLLKNQNKQNSEIAKIVNISKKSVYRILKRELCQE